MAYTPQDTSSQANSTESVSSDQLNLKDYSTKKLLNLLSKQKTISHEQRKILIGKLREKILAVGVTLEWRDLLNKLRAEGLLSPQEIEACRLLCDEYERKKLWEVFAARWQKWFNLSQPPQSLSQAMASIIPALKESMLGGNKEENKTHTQSMDETWESGLINFFILSPLPSPNTLVQAADLKMGALFNLFCVKLGSSIVTSFFSASTIAALNPIVLIIAATQFTFSLEPTNRKWKVESIIDTRSGKSLSTEEGSKIFADALSRAQKVDINTPPNIVTAKNVVEPSHNIQNAEGKPLVQESGRVINRA